MTRIGINPSQHKASNKTTAFKGNPLGGLGSVNGYMRAVIYRPRVVAKDVAVITTRPASQQEVVIPPVKGVVARLWSAVKGLLRRG